MRGILRQYIAGWREREGRHMEKRKRLFSGFDIAVVAVVVLGALAWFLVLGRDAPVAAPTFDGRTTYYIEVMSVTAEQIALVSIGDELQDGARHIPIGRVVAIDVQPHTLRVDDNETHTVSWGVVEDRYVMILTVETEVRETSRDILAEGQFAIKGGQHPLNFTGPGYAFAAGTILALAREGVEQ